MGWMGCVGCEKLQHDFVARTFALIPPVQYVLQQVSCSYEMIPNAPKYYKLDRNISLGSNCVDLLCSLRKILTWLRGTNYCNNALVHPVLHRVSCSYKTIPNASKHYETLQNMSLGSMGWIKCIRCEKLWRDFLGRTFVLIAPVLYVLHQLSCTYEMIPNAPKYHEMHRNISLGSKRVDGVRLVVKNYNATSWHELLH